MRRFLYVFLMVLGAVLSAYAQDNLSALMPMPNNVVQGQEMQERDWESFVVRMYPNLADLMRCGVSVRIPFEIVERR